MKVLVIYDEIPEAQMRTVVEMTDMEYDYFKVAHNHIMNMTEDDKAIEAITVIGNALCANNEYEKYCETDIDKKYFGKWKDDQEVTDISEVDKLICCGFYM